MQAQVSQVLTPAEEARERRRDQFEIITAVATIFLATVTLALAIFTYWLWRSTGDLVEEGATNAERELRAYVLVASARVENLVSNERPEVYIEFRNSGRTPAYQVRTTVDTGIGTTFAEIPASKPAEKSHGHIAPGAPVTSLSKFGRALTPQEFAELESGKRTVYVHGEVHYFDTFNKPHWTRFRVMTGGEIGLRKSLASCLEGNETDDEIGTLP